MDIAEFTKMALAFPLDERTKLAKTLVESVDDIVDERIEELWRLELAERIRSVESGEAEGVDTAKARSDAKNLVNEARRLSSSR